MKKFFVLSLFLVLMLSGCGAGNDNADYDLRKDRSQPNFMTNKNRQPVIGNDVTNRNPNFLALRGVRNGQNATYNNTGSDIDQAKSVIGKTKEFSTDSVWINGDQMTVTVNEKANLTAQEKRAATVQLQRKLIKALPRYQIEVRIR